jgi:hypothetical protein
VPFNLRRAAERSGPSGRCHDSRVGSPPRPHRARQRASTARCGGWDNAHAAALVRDRTDSKRRRQESDAYRLHVARSPECGADLETLSTMEHDPRNPREDIERQRKTVAEKCPSSVRLSNRWLVLYFGLLGDPR